MAKKLRQRDKLFLVLSGLVDLFEEINDPLGIPSSAYKNLYGFVPHRYRKSHLYRATLRQLKTGDIEKIIKAGKPYLRLTSQGKKKIIRDFPLLAFQGKRWDKRWRLVFFDIEETSRKTRDLLRSKLKSLGFAQIQQSVYITPHDLAEDMREFLEAQNLSKTVYVATIEKLLAGDQKALAKKLWSLDKVNEKYEKILDDWENETKDKEKLSQEIKTRYLEILTIDPLLPKDLLPFYWQRENVEKLIKRLS